MNSTLSKSFVNSLLIILLLSLVGCGDEILFSGLPEKEANRVVALLQRSGIPSNKGPENKGMFQITVDQQYFSNAVNLLDWYNYPQIEANALDMIVQDKGLVSSPTMERMRYISAKSEMVAQSLEKINGVEYASVFFVSDLDIPSNIAPLKNNSASVFIKYRPQFPINDHALDIKLLVLNSFAEVKLEDITLVTFPTYQWEQTSYTEVVGTDPHLTIKSTSISTDVIVLLVILIILLVLAILGLTVFREQISRFPILKKYLGSEADDGGTPTPTAGT